jgi:hypothetical protein
MRSEYTGKCSHPWYFYLYNNGTLRGTREMRTIEMRTREERREERGERRVREEEKVL